jgi:hypothetical protein
MDMCGATYEALDIRREQDATMRIHLPQFNLHIF